MASPKLKVPSPLTSSTPFTPARPHLAGLVKETTAPSLLEEAQVFIYTAARELPGQVVPDGYILV